MRRNVKIFLRCLGLMLICGLGHAQFEVEWRAGPGHPDFTWSGGGLLWKGDYYAIGRQLCDIDSSMGVIRVSGSGEVQRLWRFVDADPRTHLYSISPYKPFVIGAEGVIFLAAIAYEQVEYHGYYRYEPYRSDLWAIDAQTGQTRWRVQSSTGYWRQLEPDKAGGVYGWVAQFPSQNDFGLRRYDSEGLLQWSVRRLGELAVDPFGRAVVRYGGEFDWYDRETGQVVQHATWSLPPNTQWGLDMPTLFDEAGNLYKVIHLYSYSSGFALHVFSFDRWGQLRWEQVFDRRSPLSRWVPLVVCDRDALYLFGSDDFVASLAKLDSSSGTLEWFVPVDWGRGVQDGVEAVHLMAAGGQIYLVVDRGRWEVDCDDEGDCDWRFYRSLRRLLRYGSDGSLRAQFVPPYGMWGWNLGWDGKRLWWFSTVSPLGGTLWCLHPLAVRMDGDVDGNGCVDDGDLLMVLFGFGGSGEGDVNGDGVINDTDLLTMLTHFGFGCRE